MGGGGEGGDAPHLGAAGACRSARRCARLALQLGVVPAAGGEPAPPFLPPSQDAEWGLVATCPPPPPLPPPRPLGPFLDDRDLRTGAEGGGGTLGLPPPLLGEGAPRSLPVGSGRVGTSGALPSPTRLVQQLREGTRARTGTAACWLCLPDTSPCPTASSTDVPSPAGGVPPPAPIPRTAPCPGTPPARSHHACGQRPPLGHPPDSGLAGSPCQGLRACHPQGAALLQR